MAISFNEIPTNYRAPAQFVEFNNSMAMQGATQMEYKVLLIGQKTLAGTAQAEHTQIVSSYEDAVKLYGAGSHLALMVDAYRKQDMITKLYCIALADDASSVKASAKMMIAGTVTIPAPLMLYIGGKSVRIPAMIGNTASEIANSAVIAINALTSLSVTATANAGEVILTAKNAGEVGNEVDLRLSYYDEIKPSGISIDFEAFSGGAGNPDITPVIATMGDDWYHVISMPYTDRANLRVMEDELIDRWGPLRHIDGICITARTGTFGELVTFGEEGEQGNYENIVIIENCKTPDLPYVRAASIAGNVAYYGSIDPARPFQTLAMTGLLAPKVDDRLTMYEQNQLLYSGIATTQIDAGGKVQIQRVITNYQKSPSGADDTSYLDVNTKLTLSYLRFDFRARILRKYPRHKLATDASEVSPGQAIMTPKLGKAEAVSACQDWIELGLVENMSMFKEGLICERNPLDPNRLDWRMTPDLVNQFRLGAAQIQFRL